MNIYTVNCAAAASYEISSCACYCPLDRTTFTVDPDTHIDNIEQAESSVLEGTSKWSCKIAITGT
jgi:hypothetical protein